MRRHPPPPVPVKLANVTVHDTGRATIVADNPMAKLQQSSDDGRQNISGSAKDADFHESSGHGIVRVLFRGRIALRCTVELRRIDFEFPTVVW